MGSKPPIVLSIAGYDPSAGAGLLADLKTFAAIGVYGMACVTALTVQSTQGVRRVEPVLADIVGQMLQSLAEDVSFSAIKVGMLGSGEVAAVVFDWLSSQNGVPVVLDPVFISTSGKDLLDAAGTDRLRQQGLARTDWITPNLAELAVLTQSAPAESCNQIEEAAGLLQQMAGAVGNPDIKIVVTGGDAKKPDDLLLTREGFRWFPGEHIETISTHGTGCTFSSALAARLAFGDGEVAAVQFAKDYVTAAIRHAYP
ncbi:MAG: bifunctional hydroxymethylpyrimidine kinase/phosphomethylpyrimidine kinase, partial [Acidobacteriales bacterium]|nr:bifunctional hydroxymethylpyrimidine kinase/phosphomethylpyrimidine kinase [Terriglobales bacterium]